MGTRHKVKGMLFRKIKYVSTAYSTRCDCPAHQINTFFLLIFLGPYQREKKNPWQLRVTIKQGKPRIH